MDNNTLHEIVTVCLKMDEQSVAIYDNLAKTTEDDALKKFWSHMSDEERQHVTFWNGLLGLVEGKLFPQIFHRPEDTLKELEQNYNKVVELSKQSMKHANLTENLF